MSRVTLRHKNNEHLKFVHILNLLCSYGIVNMEEAMSLMKQFKLGEDVTIDLPDEVDSEFRCKLRSYNCVFD